MILDTLAVAYGAAGRFAEAVATAEKAMELAIMQGKDEFAEKTRKKLELYKAGKAYSEKSH